MAERNVAVRLSANTDQYRQAMGQAKQSTDQFATSSQQSVSKVGSAFSAVGASIKGMALPAAGAAIGTFAVKAINAASDLDESINAVRVTFGEAADDVLALGETSAEAFGLSTAAFNGAAVSFASFASSIAGPGGDVGATIEDLMLRATDFASVMNLDVNEAMDLFRSTLAGESEPIRRYGKDLSAAAVESFAYANGIADVGDKLTETQKVQARYQLLMKQTNDVSGDFANTSDSLANQQRRLSAEFTNLSAKAGALLVPALERVLEVAMPVVEVLTTMGEIIPEGNGGWSPFATLGDIFEETGHRGRILGDALLGIDYAGRAAAEVVDLLGEAFSGVASSAETAGLMFANFVASTIDAESEAANAAATQETLARSAEIAMAAFEDEIDAIDAWAQGINDATTAGAQSFAQFGEDVIASASKFRDELVTSADEIRAWQDDLIAIASQTSPEFAAYLAEMGEAAAPMVDELANNGELMNGTFGDWIGYSLTTSRDMQAAFDEVAPGMTEKVAAARGTVSAELQGQGQKFFAEAMGVGSQISAGIAAGMWGNVGAVTRAAGSIVAQAVAAARSAAIIESPSKLFARQVGAPIAEGIAMGVVESADSINGALERAIESATKDAMKAAEAMVDEVQDGLDAFWGGIDNSRSEQRLRDNVAEAAADLAEARAGGGVAAALEKLKEAKANFSESGRVAAERDLAEARKKQVDDIARAEDRLREANMRLAKSTTDMIYVDAQSRASWIETARAAGLTSMEIDGLIAKYDALSAAKARAAFQNDGLAAEAAVANEVRTRFNEAVRAGFIGQADIDYVGDGSNPGFTLAAMQGVLNKLDQYFGNVPKYAGGTRFHPGGMAIVGDGGEPEIVHLPRGASVTPMSQYYGHAGAPQKASRDVHMTVYTTADDAARAVRGQLDHLAWAAGAK